MILSNDTREKLKFMGRGAAKAWALFLTIVVPLAALITATVLIGLHSAAGATIFFNSVLLTGVGAFFGYMEYDSKQRRLERERESAEHAAQLEASRKEWAAASWGRGRTGTD